MPRPTLLAPIDTQKPLPKSPLSSSRTPLTRTQNSFPTSNAQTSTTTSRINALRTTPSLGGLPQRRGSLTRDIHEQLYIHTPTSLPNSPQIRSPLRHDLSSFLSFGVPGVEAPDEALVAALPEISTTPLNSPRLPAATLSSSTSSKITRKAAPPRILTSETWVPKDVVSPFTPRTASTYVNKRTSRLLYENIAYVVSPLTPHNSLTLPQHGSEAFGMLKPVPSVIEPVFEDNPSEDIISLYNSANPETDPGSKAEIDLSSSISPTASSRDSTSSLRTFPSPTTSDLYHEVSTLQNFDDHSSSSSTYSSSSPKTAPSLSLFHSRSRSSSPPALYANEPWQDSKENIDINLSIDVSERRRNADDEIERKRATVVRRRVKRADMRAAQRAQVLALDLAFGELDAENELFRGTFCLDSMDDVWLEGDGDGEELDRKDGLADGKLGLGVGVPF
ncbi:Mucin-12 [Agyrium rufum]|nr:Mucin-12 [Agyrium rufum]